MSPKSQSMWLYSWSFHVVWIPLVLPLSLAQPFSQVLKRFRSMIGLRTQSYPPCPNIIYYIYIYIYILIYILYIFHNEYIYPQSPKTIKTMVLSIKTISLEEQMVFRKGSAYIYKDSWTCEEPDPNRTSATFSDLRTFFPLNHGWQELNILVESAMQDLILSWDFWSWGQ